MTGFRSAVIGTGTPPNSEESGSSVGYAHGRAYENVESCTTVACADIDAENATAFASTFGLDDDAAFTDYETMLREVEPDLVSVCTPPAYHTDIVLDCLAHGVEAVHCEKPMAETWDECRLLAQEAARHDTQLTINHQRRFAPQWRTAKEWLDNGEIGELTHIETSAPDLLDWGTHCFDLCGFFADDRPAEWVLGQIGAPVADFYGGAYGHHTESQAVASWEYENGIAGLATTGEVDDVVGAMHRLYGTDGTIEVRPRWDDESPLRLRRAGEKAWETTDDADDTIDSTMPRAIEDAIRGVETGRKPELSVWNALNATELIFGVWESARRRGRVDLPLRIEDNPLEAMIEADELSVRES